MRRWWWLQQCSARIGGRSSGRELLQWQQQRLTHSCRTFHDPQRPSIYRRQRLHLFPPSSTNREFYTTAPYTRTRSCTRTDTTILQIPRSISLAIRPLLAAAAPTASITPLRRLYSHSTMAQVKWPAAEVRKTFFNFFEEKGHTLGKLQSVSLDPRIAMLTPRSQSLPDPQFLTMTPPCSSPMRA